MDTDRPRSCCIRVLRSTFVGFLKRNLLQLALGNKAEARRLHEAGRGVVVDQLLYADFAGIDERLATL